MGPSPPRTTTGAVSPHTSGVKNCSARTMALRSSSAERSVAVVLLAGASASFSSSRSIKSAAACGNFPSTAAQNLARWAALARSMTSMWAGSPRHRAVTRAFAPTDSCSMTSSGVSLTITPSSPSYRDAAGGRRVDGPLHVIAGASALIPLANVLDAVGRGDHAHLRGVGDQHGGEVARPAPPRLIAVRHRDDLGGPRPPGQGDRVGDAGRT